MAETVIQSFLAELGFKVEEKTLNAFTKSLKSSSTEAVAFGNIWSDVADEAVKGANDIVKSVFAMAAQFDQLYFASRRIGDTAENLQEAGYAFKQMGGSAQEAQQAIESLQSFIARTPGAISLLHNLGVQVINPKTNKQYSPTELMQQTQKTLHDLFLRNPSLALSEGGMIGMSERLIRMDPADYARGLAEIDEITKHFGLAGDAGVTAGHNMEHAWTLLQATAGGFFEHFLTELMPTMTKAMDGFSDALEGRWSKAWEHWGQAALAAKQEYEAEDDRTAYGKLEDQYRQGEITRGQLEAGRLKIQRDAAERTRRQNAGSTKLTDEPDLPGLDEAPQTGRQQYVAQIAGWTRQAQVHARNAQALQAKIAKMPWYMDEQRRTAQAALQQETNAANYYSSRALALAAKPMPAAVPGVEGAAAAPDADAGADTTVDVGAAAGIRPAKGGKWSSAQIAYGRWLYQNMKKHGYSDTAALSIASIAVAGEGGAPGVVNSIGAEGTGQWLTANRRAIYDQLKKDNPGKDPREIDAAYIRWELEHTEKKSGDALRGAKSLREGAYIYSHGYERPDVSGDSIARGEVSKALSLAPYLTSQNTANAAAGVQMSQKTDIHVNGSGDPHATAQAVEAAQNRVNWQLRNSLNHLV